MTRTRTSCPHCAAPLATLEAERCGYCGHLLPSTEPEATESSAPEPEDPRAALARRFAALEEHPDYARARASGPAVSEVMGYDGTQIAIGAAATAACFVIAALMSGPEASMLPLPIKVWLFPLAMGIFLAFATLRMIFRLGRAGSTPAQAVDAVVIKEHLPDSEDGQRPAFAFVTIEDSRGEREQLRAPRKLAGTLAPGDLGVAHRRGDYLLGFERFAV